MTSLASLLKRSELPITMRMERFLSNGDPVYSPEALKFASDVLSNKIGGNRKQRARLFRASGAGRCLRERMFARMGVPEERGVNSQLQNIFTNGNFFHLRWQMAGLTEGWLIAAEVPAEAHELGIGSTLDGVIWDESILEAKSINTRGFTMIHDYGAQYKHKMQLHYMFKTTGRTAGSIIYEDKNSQDWREERVLYDEEIMADVDAELDALLGGWEAHSLPPMKPGCVKEEGAEYRNCPFRRICPILTTWNRAVKATPTKEITT